jgi:hypothetical protein
MQQNTVTAIYQINKNSDVKEMTVSYVDIVTYFIRG